MDQPVFRRTSSADEEALRRIWQEAYPGDEPYADIFFRMNMHDGCGYGAETEGALCSMFFCLKDYLLHIEEKEYQTSYLYALGTLPACRGRGLGSGLTAYAAADAYDHGSDLVCLMPGSASLSSWYQHDLQAAEMFYHRSFTASAGLAGALETDAVTPEQYQKLREALLKGTPHVEIPLTVLRLQEAFARLSGGGFYRIGLSGLAGICTLDRNGEALMIRELLMPEGDPEAAAGALIRHFDCVCGEVRMPAFWHKDLGRETPDALRLPGGMPFSDLKTHPYFGLFLD